MLSVILIFKRIRQFIGHRLTAYILAGGITRHVLISQLRPLLLRSFNKIVCHLQTSVYDNEFFRLRNGRVLRRMECCAFKLFPEVTYNQYTYGALYELGQQFVSNRLANQLICQKVNITKQIHYNIKQIYEFKCSIALLGRAAFVNGSVNFTTITKVVKCVTESGINKYTNMS